MDAIRKYAMLIATLVLCGMMLMLFNNLRSRFEEVEEDYKHDRAINLSPETDSGKLSQILMTNGYVADQEDADFIADTIVARLKRGMEYPNLYHLQKRDFGKVPASVAAKENVLTNKLYLSYERLGLKDSVPENGSLDTKLDLKRENGDGSIEVRVYEKRRRGKILNVLFGKKKSDCKDVVVCLREYYVDSVEHTDIVGYAKTDSKGRVVFKGLNRAYGYSVLPLKAGCEYGSSKGVVRGVFDKHKHFGKNKTFEFEQLEHRIPMIDNLTLRQIKNDGTITVRTPQEFKAEVIKWFVLILLAWWFLVLVLSRRKRNFDPIIIGTVMFLTGMCVIVMYAIQNPLTEEMRGTEMATGVLLGIGGIALLQLVDFVKLYQGRAKLDFDIPTAVIRWLFLPFKRKVAWLAPVLSGSAPWYMKLVAMFLLACCLPFAVFNIPYISRINKPIVRLIERIPKGFGWFLLSLFITALLWTPLGKEIGGMRVNLSLFGLTFQPSEIAKYLILFYMAAFFTQNADTIIAYSQPNRTNVRTSLINKAKTLSWVIVGLGVLMGVYILLGDMGPALVIGVTFVLLYSLVKSKVNLDNLDEDDKWKRIFTCDFAMLIYGVISFAILVIAGYLWNGMETALLFACLWFLGWIVFGIAYHKQFFETAFIINMLVFVFVFGGDIAQKNEFLRNSDTVERFVQRTNMCANTWGGLDIIMAKKNLEQDINEEREGPVLNTQVANGLWAIAAGGMDGQGLGKGNPNLIPAFHTDMILSSIAEQIGWIGLLLVVAVFALLLRRIVFVGYRVGHPFAFYFCMGVAIVTAVQFFIIALGSSGMIPLTGITVPFLSYGRVSMILNLAAVGVVISLSKNIKQEELSAAQEQVRQRSVGDYNYPISIVTWTYITIAAFTLCVWQYYALWARRNTLIKPAYVLSDKGLPIIEYNPRIALLTKEMWAGNIYDRKGVLLATSNVEKFKANIPYLRDTVKLNEDSLNLIAQAHTKRYYPFAKHLFFMLGDLNAGLYSDNDNVGYMAEARYLSDMRGYDNLHDRKEKTMPKVILHSDKVKADSRYLNHLIKGSDTCRIYSYHDLAKYLKAGKKVNLFGNPLENHQKKVNDGKYDIQLTLDAKLQRDMQNRIVEYVKKSTLKNKNLIRISVVVLDAENGDLLTSANYPLPNYSDVRDLWDSKSSYNDNEKPAGWTAFTDCDLGLSNPTHPGSTAKIMSAMAGLNKLGAVEGSNTKYDIQRYEVIDYSGANPVEPPMNGQNHESVDMEYAIVISSNCYFINLVNDKNLYNELERIYAQTGVRLDGKNRTYKLYYPNELNSSLIHPVVTFMQGQALSSWERYIQDKNNGRYVNGKNKQSLRKSEWMWAWGQGTMDATPLVMARVVSAVVNKGKMPQTRFLMNEPKKSHSLTSEDNALALKSFMRTQYNYQSGTPYKYHVGKSNLHKKDNIGGKTGTPHRDYKAEGVKETSNMNDGWYVFYMDYSSVRKPKLAVAVRIERVGSGGSTHAMHLSREVVIPVLEEYINQLR